MKTNKYILFALTALFFVSCIEDESVGTINPISDIVIDEGSLEKVYNIQKNESLVIDPIVTQTDETMPLSYAWELDQEIISTEKVFRYEGKRLGTYDGRLIVSNEDGKAFFTFTLNVNSPYEYGITVLSKDTEGRTHIAFMQEPMKEGDKKEFYDENCIEKNNPDRVFASNPADIIQTTGLLLLACQGQNGDNNDSPTIYFLNEKTFVVEDYVKSEECIPAKLLTPPGNYSGVSYPVLSTDGKMYSLPTTTAVIQPHHKLTSTYSPHLGFAVGTDTEFDIITWDNEVNGPALIYNGYGPFYYGNKYLLVRDSLSKDDYFKKNFCDIDKEKKKKNKEVRALVPIHTSGKSRREFIVISKANNGMLNKAVLANFFWKDKDGTGRTYEIMDNGGFSGITDQPGYTGISVETPCIANSTYQTLLFANGNIVKKWNYASTEEKYFINTKSENLLTVGSSSKAVITSFDISEDHKKTYVAFYEPNQEGKNGSVWVFDTDTGEVLEQYNNVCYQPVKMFYKKKAERKKK